MKIGEILKSRREELGLKVKDVSGFVGVADSTYRDWENGRKIQGEPYLQLAEILNMSLMQIFGVEKDINAQKLYLELIDIEDRVKNIRIRVNQLF